MGVLLLSEKSTTLAERYEHSGIGSKPPRAAAEVFNALITVDL